MSSANARSRAEEIVEYVCQWVETAGHLEGRRGQRNLSFSLIVDKEGNQEPALERIRREVAVKVADALTQAVKERDEDNDLICEEHPSEEWPHDGCGAPGMPLRNALGVIKERDDQLRSTEEGWEAWKYRATQQAEEIAQLRACLEWLDVLGGLGLDKHAAIREALRAGEEKS